MTHQCTRLWLAIALALASATAQLAPASGDPRMPVEPAARVKRLQQSQQLMAQPATARLAEAQLFGELEQLRGVVLVQTERDALLTLQDTPVWTTLPHPEGVGVRMPQYPVAELAKSLLLADRQRSETSFSRASLGQPKVWIEQLLSAESAAAWTAPLQQLGVAVPVQLRAALSDCARTESRCATALLEMGPALTPAEFELAKSLADADAQLRWLQQLDPTDPAQKALLQRASALPQTRGVALQKLARSDDQIELLADAERGAEVASALAARLDLNLLQRLEQRYHGSHNSLEQQRVLLVLRLSALPQAQMALQQWSQSKTTLPQTREAVRSW